MRTSKVLWALEPVERTACKVLELGAVLAARSAGSVRGLAARRDTDGTVARTTYRGPPVADLCVLRVLHGQLLIVQLCVVQKADGSVGLHRRLKLDQRRRLRVARNGQQAHKWQRVPSREDSGTHSPKVQRQAGTRAGGGKETMAEVT